ncbi:MAG TPA: acyltransferase [Polyangiaceae bacterium]|nr:acyltransferase [Polyangiaceae bacterium]
MGPGDRKLAAEVTSAAGVDRAPESQARAPSPRRSGRIPTIPALTSLRFLAAAHVVLFHASPDLRPLVPGPVDRFLSAGYSAVPLFYVLSGFVLMLNYGQSFVTGRVGARSFFAARFARIYPLYLLTALWEALNFHLFYGLSWSALMLPTAREMLMVQAWHSPWIQFTNAPAWSVSNEAFFYLLFPLLARRIGVLGKRAALYALGGTWLVGMTMITVASHAGAAWEDIAYLPLAHLPEFAAGAFLGRIFELRHEQADESTSPLGHWLVLTGLGGLLLIFEWSTLVPQALFATSLLVPLQGLLIWGLATRRHAPDGSRGWDNPAFVFFGEASYALYLLQYPVKNFLLFFPQHSLNGSPQRYPLYWAILFLSALIAHQYFEGPARSFLKKLTFRARVTDT